MMKPTGPTFRPMPAQAQGTPQRPQAPNAYGLMGQQPPMPPARVQQQQGQPMTANGQAAVPQMPLAATLGQDTRLAHVNPIEDAILKGRGGSGAPNPITGMPQYANPMDEAMMSGGMMGGGMDPMMMGGPPPEEIGPEDEANPDADMAAQVDAKIMELSDDEIKVLQKALKPDVAWVLSRIFGEPAIQALLGRAAPNKESGKSGSAGAAPSAPSMPKSVLGPTSNESPKL